MDRNEAVDLAVNAIDGVSIVVDTASPLDDAWLVYAHDGHTGATYLVTIDDEGVQVEHENSDDFSSCLCPNPPAHSVHICRDCNGVL